MIDLVQRGEEFAAHYDPKQTVGHGLVVELTAALRELREEMELRQRLYDAHPGPREEEFAALRADKERLDWLAENGVAYGSAIEMNHGVYLAGATMRAAIDSARGTT